MSATAAPALAVARVPLPAFVAAGGPALTEAVIESARTLLRRAADDHPGAVVLTTSFGAEDMVLTDLIARHRLPIAVATLDTGRLHPQTLAMRERVRQRYGVTVERWAPDADAATAFDARHGALAMRRSVELRRACCALRKVEPLARALAGRTGWVTGLRRVPGGERDAVPEVVAGPPGHAALTQYNPLARWTPAQVWQYLRRFRVPEHPLHAAFYPSIGCEPCTRAITPGEDERAGRWWWEAEGTTKECGLHARAPADPAAPQAAPAPALRPGLDAVLSPSHEMRFASPRSRSAGNAGAPANVSPETPR